MKFKNSIVAITLVFIFSCNNNVDNCVADQMVLATSIEAPITTGTVNVPLDIVVNFSVNNGCGAFKRFIETRNSNLVTVEVEARFTGCICTLAIVELTNTYQFLANEPGTYELIFNAGTNEVISLEVVIN